MRHGLATFSVDFDLYANENPTTVARDTLRDLLDDLEPDSITIDTDEDPI